MRILRIMMRRILVRIMMRGGIMMRILLRILMSIARIIPLRASHRLMMIWLMLMRCRCALSRFCRLRNGSLRGGYNILKNIFVAKNIAQLTRGLIRCKKRLNLILCVLPLLWVYLVNQSDKFGVDFARIALVSGRRSCDFENTFEGLLIFGRLLSSLSICIDD